MASKRAKRRECRGKTRYATDAQAWRALRLAPSLLADGLKPYFCPLGRHWHLGHQPRRVRQAIAAKREAP